QPPYPPLFPYSTLFRSIQPSSQQATSAIHLMTAHKSKGLEFDTVYIMGATDSAWGERARTRSRLIGYPENLPLMPAGDQPDDRLDRKSTRLNSSHVKIS